MLGKVSGDRDTHIDTGTGTGTGTGTDTFKDTYKDTYKDTHRVTDTAYKTDTAPRARLFNYGFFNYLRTGEYHQANQPLVKELHSAIRDKNSSLYALYEDSVRNRPPTTIRDTLQFVGAKSGESGESGV